MAFPTCPGDCIPAPPDCIPAPPGEGELPGLGILGFSLWLCAKAGKARANATLTARAVCHSLLFFCIDFSFLPQSSGLDLILFSTLGVLYSFSSSVIVV